MIKVIVGDAEFGFNATHKDINKYLNNQNGTDKITPSVNFLLSVVEAGQLTTLKQLVLEDDNTPRGMVVMQITGLLISEMGGEIEIKLKK